MFASKYRSEGVSQDFVDHPGMPAAKSLSDKEEYQLRMRVVQTLAIAVLEEVSAEKVYC